MKKIIERIVDGPGAPSENDLWLNGTTLKKFQNGEWVAISGGNSGSGGGSGGSSSGSGCQCLAPMIVRGTIDPVTDEDFIPGEDAPTWAEAHAHMLAGGLLYLILLEDGEPASVNLALVADAELIVCRGALYWYNLDFLEPNPPHF